MASWLTRLLRGPDAPMLSGASAGSAVPAVPTLTVDELYARLEALPRTSFREGYDTDAVDDLVARCVETLDGTAAEPVSDRDVLSARFPATKFREGYDQDRVDDLLDEVVRALRARSAGNPGHPASR